MRLIKGGKIMKYGFPRDFAVRVRKQEHDEELSVAKFYRGIFSVTLNFLVEIMFIPEFSRQAERWSLDIPDNVDVVHSTQQARLFTAALSEIIVTPDQSRAGQEELYPLAPPLPPIPDVYAKKGVIFYVTPQQFPRISAELAHIAEQTSSVHDFLPLSQLHHLKCTQVILNRIMTSIHFSEKNLRIIGRSGEVAKRIMVKQTTRTALNNNGHDTVWSRLTHGELPNLAELRQQTENLETLVAGITKENRHDEIDFHPAVGEEIW